MEGSSIHLLDSASNIFVAFFADFEIVERDVTTFWATHNFISLKGIGATGTGPGADQKK